MELKATTQVLHADIWWIPENPLHGVERTSSSLTPTPHSNQHLNPLHGVESLIRLSHHVAASRYLTWNPLHGVESLSPYWFTLTSSTSCGGNPLHGVERACLGQGGLRPQNPWIHYMELKVVSAPAISRAFSTGESITWSWKFNLFHSSNVRL